MRSGDDVARKRSGAGCALSPAMLLSFFRSIVSATSKRKLA
jgi:hypothetical protein